MVKMSYFIHKKDFFHYTFIRFGYITIQGLRGRIQAESMERVFQRYIFMLQ